MSEKPSDSIICEICQQAINDKTCPEYWWEQHDELLDEVDESIADDKIRAVCQTCEEDLDHAEKLSLLDGFHKHYWDTRETVPFKTNLTRFLIGVAIIVAIIIFAILVFGTWWPWDTGY